MDRRVWARDSAAAGRRRRARARPTAQRQPATVGPLGGGGGDRGLGRGQLAVAPALAERDQTQVVMCGRALGATATALLGFIFGEPLPERRRLRSASPSAPPARAEPAFLPARAAAFGAARTGSGVRFRAPIGAALALLLGDRSASSLDGRGGVLMLAGIYCCILPSRTVTNTRMKRWIMQHAHWHDDGHHEHRHEPMPEGVHSHRHRHEPLRRSHPHVPDMHHGHRH